MKNIKTILRNQGKTQSWLATKLGVSGVFLNGVMTGRRKKLTEPWLFSQIASILDVDPSVLRNNKKVELVSKLCPRCDKVMPLASFGPNDSNYGHRSPCLNCELLYSRAWQKAHAEYAREWHRNRRKNPELAKQDRAKRRARDRKNRDKRTAYKRAHNLRHPDRAKARNRITSLLSMGKITKPTACEKCNKTRPVECHHPDYSEPLNIIWVCKPCHLLAHGKKSRFPKKGC